MAIIAAVDRSDRASNVVREAESLAAAFDEPVHVVHVLTREDFFNLGRSQDEYSEMIDMDDVRDVAADIAAETAADLDAEWESVGLVGDPEDRIAEYASEVGARYIVVAPRKRSPAGKALFGSVAQSILLNAESPVVTTVSP